MQCGTAREIIANPINDYVQDFVAHMNPLSVLSAADVMRRGSSGADRAVEADLAVKAVMELFRDGVPELAVTQGGSVVGSIRPADVMGRLINPRGI